MYLANLFPIVFLLLLSFRHVVSTIDYGAALTKSLLYYEAQRSGKLPPNQRVKWRGDSGLNEGKAYGRPEAMTTPRTCYKIDEQNPGADLVGETAAALPAAAIAFNRSDPSYSSELITHAKQLFDFGIRYPGTYQNSIQVAEKFYPSSGFEDELLWAAAWLHKATKEETYLNYLKKSENYGGTRSEFSWNDKHVGAQVLIAQNILRDNFKGIEKFNEYKSAAEQFICNCIQKGRDNVKKTSSGLFWWQPWNNLQYVTAALFVATTYADTLNATENAMECLGGPPEPEELIKFVKS